MYNGRVRGSLWFTILAKSTRLGCSPKPNQTLATCLDVFGLNNLPWGLTLTSQNSVFRKSRWTAKIYVRIDYRMKRVCFQFFALAFVLVTACTSHNDTTYLTPIPQATWQAYQRGSPVNTKLEAVIAARSSFYFHLQAVTEPIPSFVEKMTHENAYTAVLHRPRDYPDSRPKNMKVWIVLFEGDWQVLSPPPADEATPSPKPSFPRVRVCPDRSDQWRRLCTRQYTMQTIRS